MSRSSPYSQGARNSWENSHQVHEEWIHPSKQSVINQPSCPVTPPADHSCTEPIQQWHCTGSSNFHMALQYTQHEAPDSNTSNPFNAGMMRTVLRCTSAQRAHAAPRAPLGRARLQQRAAAGRGLLAPAAVPGAAPLAVSLAVPAHPRSRCAHWPLVLLSQYACQADHQLVAAAAVS